MMPAPGRVRARPSESSAENNTLEWPARPATLPGRAKAQSFCAPDCLAAALAAAHADGAPECPGVDQDGNDGLGQTDQGQHEKFAVVEQR